MSIQLNNIEEVSNAAPNEKASKKKKKDKEGIKDANPKGNNNKLKDLNPAVGESLEDLYSVGSLSSQAEIARQLGLQNVDSISSPHFTVEQINGLEQQLEVLKADAMTRNRLFLGKAKNMLEAFFSGDRDKILGSHFEFFNFLREKLNQSLNDVGHHRSLQDLQHEIVKMTIPSDLTDDNQIRAWNASLRDLCDKYHSQVVEQLDEIDDVGRTNFMTAIEKQYPKGSQRHSLF